MNALFAKLLPARGVCRLKVRLALNPKSPTLNPEVLMVLVFAMLSCRGFWVLGCGFGAYGLVSKLEG